jgi:prepilin-type N-terminal cleavage/methylation domain-containing protein
MKEPDNLNMHTPRDIKRKSSSAGFTLAELLVASVLLSIVMASVYGLFHSVLGSWRAVEENFDAYKDGRNALTLLRRDIGNIMPQAARLVEGSDNEVTLYILSEPMDIQEEKGQHLLQVRYRMQGNRGSRTLVREERLAKAALPIRQGRNAEIASRRPKLEDNVDFVLADNVRDFSIEYIWYATKYWDKKNPPPPPDRRTKDRHEVDWGLPQGVSISLTLEDRENNGDPVTMTTLIPVPMAQKDVDADTLRRRGIL